jgi:hypothetical protein
MSIGNSLIFVFVPTFLFTQGISLTLILLYATIIYAVVLLVDPFSVKLINNIGFKWSLIISIPFQYLNFFLINLVESHWSIIYIAAVVQGVYLSIFFTSLNADIATKSNSKVANDIGNLQILLALASGIAPFIGGVFLAYLPYNYLFFLSLGFTLVSCIPLLLMKDIPLEKITLRYKNYLTFLTKKGDSSRIYYLTEGAEIILFLYIWPIALYLLVFEQFHYMGLVLTSAAVVSIVIIVFLKKVLDTKPKENYLKFSAKIIGIEYLIKAVSYVAPAFFIYIVEALAKINRNVHILARQSIYFSNAKENIINYVIKCDVFGRLGRIIFCLILIGLIQIIGETRELFFYLLFLGVFFSIGLHFFKENI